MNCFLIKKDFFLQNLMKYSIAAYFKICYKHPNKWIIRLKICIIRLISYFTDIYILNLNLLFYILLWEVMLKWFLTLLSLVF